MGKKPGPKPKEPEPVRRVRVYGKCKLCGARGDVNFGRICDPCSAERDADIKEVVRRWKEKQ